MIQLIGWIISGFVALFVIGIFSEEKEYDGSACFAVILFGPVSLLVLGLMLMVESGLLKYLSPIRICFLLGVKFGEWIGGVKFHVRP